jgi:hypothetical protein
MKILSFRCTCQIFCGHAYLSSPVCSGGLGVRLAMDFTLPAFLSSVNGAKELTIQLLPSRLHGVSSTYDLVYVAASLEWQANCNSAFPDSAHAGD